MANITERLHELQRGTSPAVTPRAAADTSSVVVPESSDEQRKARTRRLIQLGAVTDQYLGTAEMSPEEASELMHRLAQLPEVQAIIQMR